MNILKKKRVKMAQQIFSYIVGAWSLRSVRKEKVRMDFIVAHQNIAMMESIKTRILFQVNTYLYFFALSILIKLQENQ